ncbi:DUF1902 domain-containing protein [Paenirhodobacter sp.]|uniref:DUF1902 domain-containing protein n=1 Tax=Paenirhodobacter sp. TaxID=1965326 RepID=UPI003B506D91
MSKNSIIVRADWDPEANVWVATSADIDGLAIEAETIEALYPKLQSALADLIELNGFPTDGGDVPVHVMADRLMRVSTAA